MALLEIIHLTGDVERRDLYKRQPMTIGSHSSNDLRIDEEGVDIMHCRISWNKDNWEAVAAGSTPFDLNGTTVQRATLKSGDTLRFGTVDVRFHGGATVEDTPKDSIGIKPTSDEAILASRDLAKQQKAVEPKKAPAPPPEKPKSPKSDEALMQSLEMLAYDSKKGGGSSKKKAAADDDDLFDVVEDEAPAAPAAPPPKAAKLPPPKKVEDAFEEIDEIDDGIEEVAKGPGIGDRLKKVMGTDQRPGETDTVRSPLVLGLAGFVVVAILVAATFYFIAGRRIAETEFEAAKAEITEEKYKSGIESLEAFIKHHPDHEKVAEAQQIIGLTKVDQYIKSGVPNYVEGVKSLREFVASTSDKPNFEALKPELALRAGNSSLGAAQLAGKNPKNGEALVKTSKEARTLLVTYSPTDAQPKEKLAQIDDTIRQSGDLILKYQINHGITDGISQALTDKKPMEALRLRRELLAQYPDLAKEPSMKKLLIQTMAVEQALIKSESPNTVANTEDEEVTLPGMRSLIYQARSKTDQVSVNQVVWVLGKDCLYGVDTITGMPVWRRVCGSDPAFFPVEDKSLPSLTYFDSDRYELVQVHRNQGTLVWRQGLSSRVSGKPLVVEGNLYLTTEDGSLLKIDLTTGAIADQLTFSQLVTGPGLIIEKQADGKADESYLVVVGDQDVTYTMTKRPLECVAVSYTAQKSQSVRAPLISVGPYAGFIENESEESSTLHLLRREVDKATKLPKTTLEEVGNGKIVGMVVDDTAVIRGRDLFVPSTVERVTAFAVSDSPDEPPLTIGPTFQVQGAKGSPIYLTTGPEHQVWMASSALRRLQLTADAIQADAKEAAIGLSSQPNQPGEANLIYNARRRPFTDAVTLTQTDRDTLTSDWQFMAGARILATVVYAGDSPALLVVNEGGATFRVTASALTQPGFQTDSAFQLPINPQTTLPLMACSLPDAQVAVVCGDPEPRIWVINRLGQIERQGAIPGNPQAAPVALGKRVIVPIEGKLHVARAGQTDSVIQDFQFPSGDAPPLWKQVLAVDDKTLLGLTEAGELLQIRMEANPKPHLAEVARQSLPGPVVGQLALFQGRFAAACATGDVLLFDAAKFEPLGRRTMETPASGAAYFTEAGVLVETGSEDLHCLNADAELTTKWSIKLSGTTLAGQPAMLGGHLVLPFQSGLVLHVNPETGAIVTQQQASGSIDSGPLSFGDQLFLTTRDGSLIPLAAPVSK